MPDDGTICWKGRKTRMRGHWNLEAWKIGIGCAASGEQISRGDHEAI